MQQARTHLGSARLRGIGASLVALIVVGACGSAAATPTQTPGASGTPSASPSPSPIATVAPTPTPAWPSPVTTTAPGGYKIAVSKAKLLAPAADNGARAGTEINDFGFDLLRRLNSKGNLCASPTSIALALAMVRPGANGLTATEMDTVLHSFGSSAQGSDVVALMKALSDVTAYNDYVDNGKKPYAELNVANGVFSQQGMHLFQAYLDSLSSRFGAGSGLLDYKNDPEGARKTINKWVNDATKGRIPEILQQGDIDKMTRISLANAIYLKAGWLYGFDEADTKSRSFTTAGGTKVNVPTMAADLNLRYGAGSGYKSVELPLQTSASMTIIVPDDMSTFVTSLSAAKLAAIDTQGSEHEVNLTLPKFSANSRTDLAVTLQAMGMKTAFDPSAADLSGITTDETLFVSNVIHQANIDVNEFGVTAAAATLVDGSATSAGETPPKVTFQINRPFLYFVREQTTGVILFMGRIDDPSAKS